MVWCARGGERDTKRGRGLICGLLSRRLRSLASLCAAPPCPRAPRLPFSTLLPHHTRLLNHHHRLTLQSGPTTFFPARCPRAIASTSSHACAKNCRRRPRPGAGRAGGLVGLGWRRGWCTGVKRGASAGWGRGRGGGRAANHRHTLRSHPHQKNTPPQALAATPVASRHLLQAEPVPAAVTPGVEATTTTAPPAAVTTAPPVATAATAVVPPQAAQPIPDAVAETTATAVPQPAAAAATAQPAAGVAPPPPPPATGTPSTLPPWAPAPPPSPCPRTPSCSTRRNPTAAFPRAWRRGWLNWPLARRAPTWWRTRPPWRRACPSCCRCRLGGEEMRRGEEVRAA